ncbi:FAD/NAD(P)-binding domain-containing protein [Polychaeton citri CBS 116435]|uniref:FAD/NAD(P)-binding domain-containing protein n=1 Tax=Polychaeton citri CBS 116435 TaxID=1314669 RepID=A0A9P4QFK9_9PEZI|nr:FAD/NAD(P)-binding domain-containing protein [Polychaeton citri CBS 116435]
MGDAGIVNKPHVLIVGAGAVGLLIAQGLKKNGISFAIYEAEPAAAFGRGREWGISVQWSLPMLPKLLPPPLLSRFQEAWVDPSWVGPDEGNILPTYNAETGELLKNVPLPKFNRVARSRFRALCAEGIDVQYDRSVSSITVSDNIVTAHFADNTTAKGTLLIGADGAKSSVRANIFSQSPTPTQGQAVQIPYAGINMHVQYNDAAIARLLRSYISPIFGMAVHPVGYWIWISIQEVPDPCKPEGWTFQLQWTWRVDGDAPINAASIDSLSLEMLKAEAARCFSAEPWRTAWEKIPPGTKLQGNRVSIWQPVPIPEPFSGKVVLAGDAGHAMSFHRGQGLNHGINDAMEIVEALCRKTESQGLEERGVDELMREYEVEMVKRAGDEVEYSKKNTEMVHDWDQLMASPIMQRGGYKGS